MADKHDTEIPVALERVVAQLRELEVVLGTDVAPVLDAVRTTLLSAMAARDRGDVPGAIVEIGQAMDRLAALADRLDPAEAVLMRALAANFRAALLRGDTGHAQRSASVMFEKSGALEKKRS
jgi:hypothetical protein